MQINPDEYQLMILLKDMDSVPDVFIAGDRMDLKVHVNYQYETTTELPGSGVNYYEVKTLCKEEFKAFKNRKA